PWGLAGIAPDFNNRLLPEDWPRFMPLSQNAITRVPALEKGDVVKLINGPEAFTPDNEFLLGESAVRGFYVAAGFCAHGIAGAGGGAGRRPGASNRMGRSPLVTGDRRRAYRHPPARRTL